MHFPAGGTISVMESRSLNLHHTWTRTCLLETYRTVSINWFKISFDCNPLLILNEIRVHFGQIGSSFYHLMSAPWLFADDVNNNKACSQHWQSCLYKCKQRFFVWLLLLTFVEQICIQNRLRFGSRRLSNIIKLIWCLLWCEALSNDDLLIEKI